MWRERTINLFASAFHFVFVHFIHRRKIYKLDSRHTFMQNCKTLNEIYLNKKKTLNLEEEKPKMESNLK